jgi:hypothetical protein
MNPVVYNENHTNLPIQDCLGLNSGVGYGYDTAYIDLERIGPAIFSNLHLSDGPGLSAVDDGLGSVLGHHK